MVSLSLRHFLESMLKRFAFALLFLAAVSSGTATVYLNSIRQAGEWLHWVMAMVVISVLLLAALPGVWFGLLNNCHLSGAIRVEQTLASPDGRWVAVHFSSNCTAIARACPGTSNVSLLRTGERLAERHGAVDYLGKPTRISPHWAGITIESLQMMWM